MPPGGRLDRSTGRASGTRRDSDEDQVSVPLTKGFWMQETPVTQGLWQAVMGSNPSHFKGSPDLPVEQVTWQEASDFGPKLVKLLTGEDALPRGWKIGLPTEAQWEYACRAGTTTRWPFGDQEKELGKYAWYDVNSGGKTHEVKGRLPNAWGLHDMLGNVWEWCQDVYLSKLPGGEDPVAAVQASSRVLRGGGWDSGPASCRPAYRFRDAPENRTFHQGFRLAAVQE